MPTTSGSARCSAVRNSDSSSANVPSNTSTEWPRSRTYAARHNSPIGKYGLDAWRYYLCTQGPLGSTDADLSATHFHEIYNTDLVNTVGNCASRVTSR